MVSGEMVLYLQAEHKSNHTNFCYPFGNFIKFTISLSNLLLSSTKFFLIIKKNEPIVKFLGFSLTNLNSGRRKLNLNKKSVTKVNHE